MPQRLKRKCNQFGCNALTIQSYCKKHEKPRKHWGKIEMRRDRTPDGKRIYDKHWSAFRKEYFKEHQNVFCVECKRRGVLVGATEIDHIIPLVKNMDLKYDLNNLQPLCKPCHSRKTAYDFNRNRKFKKTKKLIEINPD